VGADGSADLTVRTLIPSLFLPAVVYEIGNGAVAPVLALAALNLGASPALAGVVVALLGLGQLAGNVPAAALVDRVGDRRAMIVAAATAGAGMLVLFFAGQLWMLALVTVLVGACNATFYLARHSFVTVVVSPSIRAAVMSTVGGSHRVGLFLGPLIGAAVIGATSLRGAFLVAVVAIIATIAILLVVPEPRQAEAFARRPREATSVASVWREHSRLLLTLGGAVFAIGAVRAARPTVLPLWADHIGLDARTTSLVFAISAAVDMALFYPAGKAMDRYGRLFVAVPSMLLLGGAMMVLPLTGSVVSLTLAAVVMSLGNGLGSGIVMTLGADVAPAGTPVRFLSQWRFMSDSGNSSGPLLVAALAAVSLGAAVVVAGVVGLLAAAALARWAPFYSPFATLAMVRAARSGQNNAAAAG
jgi:MFS family permease